ncbi:hypothetical protein JOF47_003466 [Paeniglutamicibacter kerguelensis]|uniref:Uncharacterized protein n=1 Tax=Paeniglutamicibacter kerguelensis TaxID=254788 RepID=A0ABS4XHP7_9MICC|nr:hypothetical protein [Paeniglutamicibacter kerguelensis]
MGGVYCFLALARLDAATSLAGLGITVESARGGLGREDPREVPSVSGMSRAS